LPAEQFISGLADDCIAVRDYGDHRGLHRVLEAAGIAQPLSRDSAGGAPVVIMRVAACLLAKMPTARPQQKASACPVLPGAPFGVGCWCRRPTSCSWRC